ncbi:MAG: type II toxin-antitoxin system RelE/ParE family toxin [Clostridiales bacterium]|nr:type II toxin-antitoxin system RelE/ParE family toxin [Clostridiales bacterium]
MNAWRTYITEQAEYDIRSIHEYIAHTLFAPDAAKRITSKLMDSIDRIEELPKGCPILRKEPWHSRGVRRKNSGNFAIFYVADDATEVVTIIRIMYSGRNVEEVLDGTLK